MNRHVCFDCDNCLYEETPEIRAAWNDAIVPAFAEGKERPVEQIREYYMKRYDFEGSHTRIFTDEGLSLDLLAQAKVKAGIHTFLQKDPELVRLFKSLRKDDFGISVFSTSIEDHVLPVLDILGVRKYVDFVVTPTTDGVLPKPSDTGYSVVEEKSGCSGSQILMVGDRVEIDLKTAKARGWKTCYVVWDTKRQPVYPEAIVDRLVIRTNTAYDTIIGLLHEES